MFCVDVAHAADLSQAFRSFGVDARYIHSKTPANERKDMLAVFKDGEFPVLVNCGRFPSLDPNCLHMLFLRDSYFDGRDGYPEYRLCHACPPHPLSQPFSANGTRILAPPNPQQISAA